MQSSTENYPEDRADRPMKVQEVIFRAVAKKITWRQAAEIIGNHDRQMQRWHSATKSTFRTRADRQAAMKFVFRNVGIDCAIVGYKSSAEIDKAIENMNLSLA